MADATAIQPRPAACFYTPAGANAVAGGFEKLKTLAARGASPQVIVYVSGAEIRTIDADGAHESLVFRVSEGCPAEPPGARAAVTFALAGGAAAHALVASGPSVGAKPLLADQAGTLPRHRHPSLRKERVTSVGITSSASVRVERGTSRLGPFSPAQAGPFWPAPKLNHSPFVGPLFEGFVAAEILKQQIAAGRSREIYYFRDQQGLEVDFVVPGRQRQLLLVEAKASRTATPDMAAPLDRLPVHPPLPGSALRRPSSIGAAANISTLRPGVAAGGIETLLGVVGG